MEKEQKFYLGLDIGTNSVGIACTDENYNLLRVKGKDCWAVRLFDEAQTAADRRTARTARRRLQRRRYRINQLQGLFAPFMQDNLFFLRLNNSQFFADDKAGELDGDVNNLFADSGFTDRNFHEKYPTIYHLRFALQQSPVDDIRLYYLALHHIIKYRGHFLYDGNVSEVRDVHKLFDALNTVCENTFAENTPHFDIEKADESKNMLLRSKGKLKETVKSIKQLFSVQNDDCGKIRTEIINGFCGAKFSPEKLLGDAYSEEKSFAFRDVEEDAFEAMQSTYGDDFALLKAMREIYNFVTFERLFNGQPNISSAMIAVYDKHKSDLKKLKGFIKKNYDTDGGKKCREMFSDVTQKANYVNYVGHVGYGKSRKRVKTCDYDSFIAYVKKFLMDGNFAHDETYDEIMAEIEAKTFLPKILHSDNGLVPHQVNEDELVKIVAQMVRAFPETAQMANKILPLFLFRIPYYVGPLVGSNSWAVRKSDEKITPWNFRDVVDEAASNEEFMRRMTNKCTYLHGVDVLPKCSIAYQKFNTLNQINKLKVNDCAISVPLKQKIFAELFLVKPRVSDKMIASLIVREGAVAPGDSVVLSGKDGGDIKASMSSYIQLKRILGDFVDYDLASGGNVCENIILWHTLNTDKRLVEDLIVKNYGDNPAVAPYVKQLKGLVFNDFGKLSGRLLTELDVVDKQTGELCTVTDLLWNTNENFNELMFDKRYNLEEVIAAENEDDNDKVDYREVQKLYVSPAVRRGIWQSLQMVDEYVAALGKEPDKVFVEVSREEGVKGDKGRTHSRKKQLLEKYKNINPKDVENIDELTGELNSDKISDMRLRQERLYLYFRQLGRCMYSGEPIDLDHINDSKLYDVDHILPRSYIKDDSLDNKVLVLRSKNAEKSDTYPLPLGFTNQQGWWKMLRAKDLISSGTYDRLMRTAPLTDDDYNDFINRQKVITDQTSKAVIELLKRKYPSATLVYSKAVNVADFKSKFDLYKCRETNDLHHARDAYLNVVVGNVYSTVFGVRIETYVKDGEKWKTYNLKKMFTRDVPGAWNENSIRTVKGVYNSSSMCVTRYAYCNKGAFYKQTVYSGNENITAPRKGKGPLANMERYGGYMTQSTAYFAIVESQGKKGRIKTIEAVPVMVDYQSRNDPDRVVKYFEENGLVDVKLIVPKIKIKQLVSYNGSRVYLAGVGDVRILVHNATELFVDNKIDDYVNQLLKLVEMAKQPTFNKNSDCYIVKTNRMGDIKLVVDKESNVKLYDELILKLECKRFQGFGAYTSFRNVLTESREKFVGLSTLEQAIVLLEVLNFFKNNADTADLSLIGESKCAGKLRFSKNITDVDFRIISQSPCGLTVHVKRV